MQVDPSSDPTRTATARLKMIHAIQGNLLYTLSLISNAHHTIEALYNNNLPFYTTYWLKLR